MILPMVLSLTKLFDDPIKWTFIVSNLLSSYIINTIILVLCVSFFSVCIGYYASYMMTQTSFKGKSILSILLYLPLAMPAYILSYVYVDTLSFSGRIYRFFLSMGISLELNLFSMSMAVFVLTLSLFPYVYIPLSTYFRTRNQHHIDVAKMLRVPLIKRITNIYVPLMLPTLLSSTMLIIFETVNDYGVTKYLNIKTLSVGIFDAWFQLNDLTSALYLAFGYVVIVLIVYSLYKVLSKDTKKDINKFTEKRYYKKLTIKQTWLYITPLWIIVFLSLGLPLIELVLNILQSFELSDLRPWFEALIWTISIALLTSLLIMLLSVIIANAKRFSNSKIIHNIVAIPILGYALPGVMMALMYYIFYINLDRFFRPLYQLLSTQHVVLSVSIWMLITALVFRFFAIGYKQVSNQYTSIGTYHALTSYTLKKGKWTTLLRIDIPMIKKSLIAGFILSFIDIIKELPLTLLLRPFNVQTLSTLIFTYMNNEDINKASFASLTLILLSFICILIVTSLGRKPHDSRD